MRYKITIEYDGSGFLGWQKQNNGISIQEVLEIAVSALYAKKTTVTGAGRTDVGVHAKATVAHFDASSKYTCISIANALNFYIRRFPISILQVESVPDDFHSRFSATGRHYLYRILNRRAPSALDEKRVWHIPAILDEVAMNEAAKVLLGTHDFTSFRNSMCQAKSPIRTLDRLDVIRKGEEIHIIVEARSFLHNQVRIIVGTLFNVGLGKLDKQGLIDILESKDRNLAGPTAPACGLYLMQVDY